MAKGHVCKVINCDKLITQNKHTTCSMHFSRWRRRKSYDLPIRETLPPDIVKVCHKHGRLTVEQVVKTNIKRKRAKNCPGFPWRDAYCIYCHKINQQKGRLKNKYGMTKDQYKEMMDRQNNRCAVCNNEEPIKTKYGKTRKLAVDHCHKTGKNRDLLCAHCNTGIGMFKESIETLKKAIKYLRRHGATD